MSIELIRDIMDEFEKRSFSEIECELQGVKVRLSKNKGCAVSSQNFNAQNIETNLDTPSKIESINGVSDSNYKVITSPMVGTFYSCPKPDSKSYVNAGDNVKKGDIVCVIEAMKLMNEIESDIDGEIVEVLVKDGQMVEFGQELFKVR